MEEERMATAVLGRSRISAIVVVGALLVAACGTAATPVPTTAPTSAPQSVAPSATPGLQALPPAEQSTVRFATSTTDILSFTMPLALAKGLFAKYGLTVTGTVIEGNQPVLQAIIANQVDAISSGSTATLLSLTTSTPLVDVAIISNKLPDYIYGAKGVTTADHLRGQRVGVSGLGGQSHAEVVVGLAELGLKPTDVTIAQIGGQSQRLAALEAGSIKAAPADPTQADRLTANGFSILVKLPESKTLFAGGGVTFRRDYVAQNPNTVLRFVLACLEARQLMFTNTADVGTEYAKYASLTDVAKAQADWATITKGPLLQRDMRSSAAAYEAPRTILLDQNPAVASLNVADAWNGTFIDKLESMGYFKELGVPTS
jgi:ABC-type nitrate/sulfonate/bicarbonate transport system substrate-binding protein